MRLLIEGARHRLKRAAAALCVVAAFGLPVAASAEVKEVQIARGFAIPHLPIMIMEHDKLLEKHALAAGLGDIRVTYSTIGGGSVMNDSLISGALSFGVGGPPPMLTLWDKTRSGIRVKGVCAEATMPLLLNTRNPNLKTVKDLTERDKIAVGAVKVSIQARLLQMAAAKAFGDAEFARFDALTVGMNSPDASAALRSGAGEVNTNFSLPPFQYAELKVPGIHTLVSSNDIMGGPHTFTMVYATSTFHDANPKTFQAFLAARNIGTGVHYVPVHMHPYYRTQYGYRPESFPVAYHNFERMISLPLNPRLSDQDVADVIDAVLDVVQRFRR